MLGEKTPFPSDTICRLTNLRTLWVQSNGNKNIGAALSNVFEKLTSLRSLILHKCDIEEIPSFISKLIHLRLLDLSENKRMKNLPKNVCELYNLQTLNVTGCRHIQLPGRMEKLINLRHLCNGFTPVLPKVIGRLTSLRTLTQFIIYGDADSVSLGDLKSLIQL